MLTNYENNDLFLQSVNTNAILRLDNAQKIVYSGYSKNNVNGNSSINVTSLISSLTGLSVPQLRNFNIHFFISLDTNKIDTVSEMIILYTDGAGIYRFRPLLNGFAFFINMKNVSRIILNNNDSSNHHYHFTYNVFKR
jgi:hypothetical protein